MSLLALPRDITRLITGYLTKPTYEISSWVKKIPGLTNGIDNLNSSQAKSLLSNPRAVIPENWKKVYPLVSQVLDPDTVVYWLACNHTARAIKLIMSMNNWLDLIVSLAYSEVTSEISIIDVLLKNPYSTPIIDALYYAFPNLFKNPYFQYQIARSQSAENIIQHQTLLQSADLVTNPSEKIYNNTIGKFTSYMLETHLINLLQNPNPSVIELTIPYLSIYLDIKFNYGVMTSREQDKLNNIIRSLIENPNPRAAEILEKIIGNVHKNYSGSTHSGLLSCILNEPKTYENSSNFIFELIKEYGSNPVYEPMVYAMSHRLAKNTNPKIIEFLANFRPKSINDYRFRLGSNPAACEFINLNPEIFSDVPGIFANPEIFVPIINFRLVRRVEKYIYSQI